MGSHKTTHEGGIPLKISLIYGIFQLYLVFLIFISFNQGSMKERLMRSNQFEPYISLRMVAFLLSSYLRLVFSSLQKTCALRFDLEMVAKGLVTFHFSTSGLDHLMQNSNITIQIIFLIELFLISFRFLGCFRRLILWPKIIF